MDISGRAAADVVKSCLQTEGKRRFWRIASLTFLGSLTVATLFVAVAPLPAHADNDKDSRHEREDNDKDIRAEIADLKATVSALQGQVNTLQTANADLQKEITTLQSQLTAVQSNHALLLGPFVNVDPNPEIGVIGPNIIFSGANIHIVSGSGSTFDNGTGLGNLIIGYDEIPSSMTGPILNPGDRAGSHNLVIGTENRFTKAAFGGLVAGVHNTISNDGASVSGGSFNTASGLFASVSGGGQNTASGLAASVSGGSGNTASGLEASVSGGSANTASIARYASVCGGEQNTASAEYATVCGGQLNSVTADNLNTFSGAYSVILGGQGNTVSGGLFRIAPQPPFP
jgi:hypothetical protein